MVERIIEENTLTTDSVSSSTDVAGAGSTKGTKTSCSNNADNTPVNSCSQSSGKLFNKIIFYVGRPRDVFILK